MPYDSEIPPGEDLIEPSPELDRLAYLTIGAAIEVHRELAPGCPESAYQRGMELELSLREIPFERQERVKIWYKGVLVGECTIDLLIGGKLMVEMKSAEAIAQVDRLQTRTYMRMLRQPLGLLLNFNVALTKEGVHRIIASELDPRFQQ